MTYLAKEKRKGNYEDEVLTCFHKAHLERMFIKKDANVSISNDFLIFPHLSSIEFETHLVIVQTPDNDRSSLLPLSLSFIVKILINSRQRRSIARRVDWLISQPVAVLSGNLASKDAFVRAR